jgi:hypothetical protein
MAQIGTALAALVLFAILVIAGGLLFSLPVWLLWNYCLVGAVAGVSQITWLQAWGITVLCAFLFKSSSSK